MMTHNKKSLQVASVVKRALIEVLHKLGFKYITISEVSMSSDVKYADVFFWPLKPNTNAVKDLEELAPMIRRKLSKIVRLRYTPELRFKLDTTFDSFSKVNSILQKHT